MRNSRVIVSAIVVLLASLAISEGMSLSSLGVELHCRCIMTESKHIGSRIAKAELIPPNPHCDKTEIIATLKTGEQVCLDPEALWVKKVIQRIMSSKKQ
ncbi:Interleukin-8 [Channa argus]|uniref:Interleukin-8 n=1 Tax=Channa argus TaxID=215402 RepID=A0A6G1PBX1_CHAAH|nr:Interleukin-8 [Channa argus]